MVPPVPTPETSPNTAFGIFPKISGPLWFFFHESAGIWPDFKLLQQDYGCADPAPRSPLQAIAPFFIAWDRPVPETSFGTQAL